MKMKLGVALAVAVLLGLPWLSGSPALAQTPVVQQIPWTLKTSSFATADFLVSRALSYSSSGSPVAWSEQGAESFLLGNATILLGRYKALTSLDFSKQLWLTIKAKKSDGTWVTLARNQRVALWSFYSMWSDESGHAASADSAANAAHSDSADTATAATMATMANSAATCTNWVGVSCPDGQCLKGFTAAGAPTCVPCGSSTPGGTAQQWSSAAGGNNHWYEAVHVPAGINWSDARAAAESRGGYLATVSFGANSAAENSFIFSLVTDIKFWHDTGETYWGPWLGGNRNQISDEWEWVTGEAWSFTNWGSWFSPGLFERGLQLHSDDAYSISAEWNDLTETSLTKGYIVEWNTRPW